MAALVFPEFQTLDYFGPIEMLGGFRDDIEVITVAKEAAPVVTRHRRRLGGHGHGACYGAADLCGLDAAREMAEGCEYEWYEDPDRDPFARSAGLI